MKLASIQIKANDLRDFKQAWERLEQIVLDAAKDHDLVLVPECAFPAYFLHPDEGDLDQILTHGDKFLTRIKEIAKQQNSYIAYGFVESTKNQLFNTALLINHQGEELAKKRKSFLWHFDSKWFTEGEDIAVVDTDFGKVGLVVCADARMPEIVRMAALEGAQLIIDLANLTATGPEISALQNVQSAYMLSVRALENQVWLAVSDKWGVEANSITYTGRSSVFAPDGTCLYQAASDQDEIVSVEIPTDAKGKIIPSTIINNIDRRPELYGALTADTQTLPITAIIKEHVIPSEITPNITTAAGEFSNPESYIQMIRRLTDQGSDIICMSPTFINVKEHVDQIQKLLPEDTVVVATVLEKTESMMTYIITYKGIEETYRTLHSEESLNTQNNTPPIYQTKWGKIGIMHDREALLPEWPRTLMLLGADCLIWPNRLSSSVSTNVGRTRAAENRIYVVSAQSNGENVAVSQIIDPNGACIASTLKSETIHACGALTPFVNSRIKEIVPGTNVVKNRRPEYYGGLTR